MGAQVAPQEIHQSLGGVLGGRLVVLEGGFGADERQQPDRAALGQTGHIETVLGAGIRVEFGGGGGCGALLEQGLNLLHPCHIVRLAGEDQQGQGVG